MFTQAEIDRIMKDKSVRRFMVFSKQITKGGPGSDQGKQYQGQWQVNISSQLVQATDKWKIGDGWIWNFEVARRFSVHGLIREQQNVWQRSNDTS